MKKSLYEELKQRGFVYQMNAEEETIKKVLDGDPITFYLGIDPTANSIHLGTLVSLMFFRILQRYGHRGLLLLGGATGQIGDPSGRNDMRVMSSKETTNSNVESIKNVVSNIIDLVETYDIHPIAWNINNLSQAEILKTEGVIYMNGPLFDNRSRDGNSIRRINKLMDEN